MRIGLLVFSVLLVSGCTSGLKRPVHEVTASIDAQGIQQVKLDTRSFYFEPNRVVVKANKEVELRIHNGAFLVPHNFTLRDPDAGLDVETDLGMFGGSKTVRFTPKKPGEYPFFCDKDGHLKKGMKGTLVVMP